MLVFRKMLRTYQINDLCPKEKKYTHILTLNGSDYDLGYEMFTKGSHNNYQLAF